MTRHIRKVALATLLTLGAGLVGSGSSALAQGPPNTYEDFPYNQGSLFYRPLKPRPRVRTRVVPRQVYVAPSTRGGYTYVQPGTNGANAGPSSFTARSYGYYSPPRYYYPTAPAPVQPYGAAPVAPR
jgi:hypothetical protein